MTITKIINNNVVCCTDEEGRELVVMGCGLGFQAHSGEAPNPAKVEKVFRMESQNETNRLKALLTSLPTEQIALCTRIIAYATETLNKRLNENVYITLTDHICFAISRKQQGLSFQNALLTEVRTFYPREFAVGRHALALIREELNVDFADDEAASIALHLVNAEYGSPLSDTLHSTQALHDILSILDTWPGICLRTDALYYDEFMIHLKFLVLRAFSGEADSRADYAFLHTVSVLCPQEYRCAQNITSFLEKQSHHPLSPESAAYLALQMRRVGVSESTN